MRPQQSPASSVACFSQRITKGLCWWLDSTRSEPMRWTPFITGTRSGWRSMAWRPWKCSSSQSPKGRSRQQEAAFSSRRGAAPVFLIRRARVMRSRLSYTP